MAIGWGLGWKRWSKNGAGKSLYFTQLFLRHILFDENFIGYVNLHHILFDENFIGYLKYLYIQYAWISIMKNQKCECWKDGGTCQNLLTITITSFNFLTVLQNFEGIWNWNLDRNLFMALLIMAICKVLFEKLYIILR